MRLWTADWRAPWSTRPAGVLKVSYFFADAIAAQAIEQMFGF
jgi:hypothetical protein